MNNAGKVTRYEKTIRTTRLMEECERANSLWHCEGEKCSDCYYSLTLMWLNRAEIIDD